MPGKPGNACDNVALALALSRSLAQNALELAVGVEGIEARTLPNSPDSRLKTQDPRPKVPFGFPDFLQVIPSQQQQQQ